MRIANDILDFSKIEARKLELEIVPFELRDCLEDVVKLIAIRGQEKGLDVHMEIARNVPNGLLGDPGRLRQVLLNLLENALKFTKHGSVSLVVTVDTLTGSETALHFAVADTGIGIAKEKQTLIFDAFSQADNSSTRKFGGTGLGLTISSQLVQLMNGTIWVESEPDRGSTFHFTGKFAFSTPFTSDPPQPLELLLHH